MKADFDCTEHLEVLRAMDTIVRHVADEEAIDFWFENVPEDTGEEELRYIANDSELFEWSVADFLTIMREPGNGGLDIQGHVYDLQGGTR